MAGGEACAGHGVPLEDSNCAAIGGAEDKAHRKSAAATEGAWLGAGRAPGLQIWRIEAFQVAPWERSQYGKFCKGDSYIILQTLQGDKELDYHIFFWLGTDTSVDEMGVAAYKTVELDDFLDGKPTQSREVMGNESRQFRALFPKLTYLEGGVDSGFHHTTADVFVARLFQVRKTKQGVVEKEVTMSRDSLNEGDCFVLDAGTRIYIWHGHEAAPLEKYEANTVAERLESQRLGHAEATHEPDERFWALLGGPGPIRAAAEADDRIPPLQSGEGILFKLVHNEGDLEVTEVGRRDLRKAMLDTNHVMMLDLGAEIFVWVGRGADEVESKNAFRTAWSFLKANERDARTPVHLYKEGNKIKNDLWHKIFAD